MEVLITIKAVYGKELIYPANDTAKLLTRLTGRTTLSNGDLSIAQEMGYTVKVFTPSYQF